MSSETKPDANSPEDLAEDTLLSHLTELRERLLKMAAAILVVFACLVPFAKRIFETVSGPISEVLPAEQLLATNTIAPLLVPFKLAFFLSLFIAMPIILYQLWAFIAPGLYKKEKRFAFPLLGSSIVLFYVGGAFAYFVVFPLIFNFMAVIAPDNVNYMPDISSFLGFLSMLVLVFGIAFEVPIATVLLVWTGLTSPEKLARARPYVFLMAFVVGMFLTPPDVISQTLLAMPVYLLFELGIFMSRMFTKHKDAEEEPVGARPAGE